MTKHLTIITLLFFSTTGFSQNVTQQVLLDKFEEYVYQNEKRLTDTWNPELMYSQNRCISDAQQANYGSTCSGVLDALIVMYETTCNIEYLERFMKISANFLEARADRISPKISSAPYWFRDYVYLHPRILSSCSKFVYMVRKDWQTLYNLPIANPAEFGGNNTFGEFADWLNTGNIEMMDYMLANFWRNNEDCMGKPGYTDCNSPYSNNPPIFQSSYAKSSTNTSKRIMEMNMQMPWGYSLIYMYMANQNRTDYGVKALSMVKAIFKNYNGENILRYVSGTKSYEWYHDGWQQTKGASQSVWSLTNNTKEDIGHAAYFLKFAEAYNQFKNNFSAISSNYAYFEWYHMARLRNTFTRKVYRGISNYSGYYNQGIFNSNVFGQIPDASNITPFVWSSLYKYDNTSISTGTNDVYDILLDHYEYQLSINDFEQSWYNGVHIWGFADFIAAYYDKHNISIGCKVQSPKSSLNDNLGDHLSSSFEIKIYPNPSVDHINIEGDFEEGTTVKFYSTDGKMVLDTYYKELIEIAELKEGVYVVVITDKLGTILKRERIVKN